MAESGRMDMPHFEKLNGSNYALWKLAMVQYYKVYGLGKYIDGSMRRPTRPEEFEAWDKSDGKAQLAILSTIESSQLTFVSACETAAQMWANLKAVYERTDETNIISMRWRVVHFIKENTVEAVPASWVKDINGCFWPPYSGLELRNLIKNCTPPSYDWDLYHSRPIGELYGDLSVAKSKAAQTEETSDLASENERRKIKKKRFTSDSDSDSNPITFNISHKKKSIINEESEESDKENEIVYIPILRKATKENSVASVSKNMASIQTDSVPRTSKEEIPNTVKPQDASKDEVYKRQVLRMLSILNYKMDQIAEDLNNLKINNIMEKEVPVMESLFEKFNFPLNSMEELHNLEIYLENDEKRKEVVIELSRFGGTNPKIMVKRIMEKVFSNELAVQYSWLGFKKKENFSNLILSQIIIKSVMALHTSTTASDVESAIKMWLVKAKERIQKQQQE